jgi:hypothetical protein
MIRRLARAVLFGGTLIALWLIAAPAFAASAPLCDDRGATGLAPPPPLESPEDVLARAASPTPDCLGGGTARELAFTGSNDAPAPPAADGDYALSFALSRLPLCASTMLPFASAEGDAREGAYARIERPPRA